MAGLEVKNKTTRAIYLVAFLTSVHYALVVYINSSYLAKFLPKESIGILYAIAAAITILIIPSLSTLLKKFGQFKIITSLLFLDLLAIITLAITDLPLFAKTSSFTVSDGAMIVPNANTLLPLAIGMVLLSFLIFQIAIVLNRILLDIYLEEFSKENETGSNRGWFLSAMNMAFVFSPFVVGRIITGQNNGFWKIYSISAVFLLAAIAIIAIKLKHIKDVAYHSPPFLRTIKKISRNKNIANINISSFLLEFFYSWMVIYTPIYLYERIGLAWSQIGIVFSIMLTAFIIFELPLGKIADEYLGEKEILTAGFIIMGISTGLLAFITSQSLIVWSLALFATRVGAAAVEIMNDTYFFKKVRAEDADVIAFFRNTSPTAYIIGPALASLILYFVDYRYLFLILSAIMLSGVKFSLAIKDTL